MSQLLLGNTLSLDAPLAPCLPLVLLASLASPPALADRAEPITLPPVSIQAPSSGEFTDSHAISQPVTRYDESALGVAHERTVDEILRGEPGLSITKGGAHGFGFFHLRGAGGQGLVTLDGLPVPDSLPGVMNVNALLPDGLEQMDVGRGFGSAAQPFSALGGAIRMTAREAIDNSGDIRVEGGSFGFLKETLRGNLAGQRARLAVTVNRSDAFDGAWHAEKSYGNPERDPFHGTQVLTKVGADLGDAVSWEGSLWYRESRNGWDRYGLYNGAIAMVDEKGAFFSEESWMAQSSLKARLAADWATRLQLGYTRTRNQVRTMGLNPGYTADLYLARWENDLRLWHGNDGESIHLVWGAEGRHESASGPVYLQVAPAVFAPGAPFDEARTQEAGFVEARFAHGSLSGNLGVRHESYNRFSDPVLFHAGAVWQVLPSLKLRANGGNGFRIPSYAEQLFPLLGNLNLKPEQGVGGDLGLEWRPLTQLTLNLTGFYNRYDDLIIVTWNPQPSAQIPCAGECVSNLPRAAIAGLEAGGEFTFSEAWRGGAAYTYTDSRNLANDLRVPFRPRDSVRVWGEWRASALPVILWAEGIYRGLAYNDVGNTLDVNDAFRVNARIDYRLTPKLDVYVRGENLSNDQTPDAYSFDHPGAAVYGGVNLRL